MMTFLLEAKACNDHKSKRLSCEATTPYKRSASYVHTPVLHQLFIKREGADRPLVKIHSCATRISELKEGRARSQPVKPDRNFISFCLTRFAPHHDYIGNYLTIYSGNTMSLRNVPSQQLNLLQHSPP